MDVLSTFLHQSSSPIVFGNTCHQDDTILTIQHGQLLYGDKTAHDNSSCCEACIKAKATLAIL